jgi:integrase
VWFEHRKDTGCRDDRYHKSCEGRWSATISRGRKGDGKRDRKRLTARTRTELLAKLRDAQQALETGLKVSRSYTVETCLDDFVKTGLEGLAPNTVKLQKYNIKLLNPVLGAYKLRELTAVQVQDALRAIAETHTSRTVAMCKNTLERAIRLAQAHDKVARNVAEVIKPPAGQKESRARQSFSVEEMFDILDAANGYRNMDAYIHLAFTTGVSPDEARGLHWSHVDDLDSADPGIDVTRTLRHSGGTKTAGRRRGLGLPQLAVDALKRHRAVQNAERLAAGERWEDYDLVFCTSLGRPLARHNVARAFKAICKKAGIQDWDKRVPYEMRHTYASIVHDSGVSAEEVAQQLGHSRTQVFELVYRHVLKSRRREGQKVMDTIAAQRTG